MSEDSSVKHYILVPDRDFPEENLNGELVVARPRDITVLETAYIAKNSGESLGKVLISKPGLVYCIEEACRRALECQLRFPIVLEYKGRSCVVLTRSRGQSLAKGAILNDNLSYCATLYELLS